jgi:hypothetical protein
LRSQEPSRHAMRLLLLVDGYDELQQDVATHMRDLLAMLCGGEGRLWPSWLLKCMFTTRPNRLSGRAEERAVFGHHQRCELLPFTKGQVRSRDDFVCQICALRVLTSLFLAIACSGSSLHPLQSTR